MIIMEVIKLKEETDHLIPKTDLAKESALSLNQIYGKLINVDFPTPLNNNCYVLRPKGYIGQIPVLDDLLIRIRPKVPIKNVFGMLEHAYKLKSFKFIEGIVDVDSLDDVFERLASILAKRVLDRTRKGLYQDYIEHNDSLPYLRGRLLLNESLHATMRGSTRLLCHYEEHTADLEDNRILAWTLYQIPRFYLKRQDVLRQVKQAYRILAGPVEVKDMKASSCIGRFYHRLNEDYQPIHGLCRFFLEHCGPTFESGGHNLMPFVVHMPNLFESFVAEWFRTNLPYNCYIESQYKAELDESGFLFFKIDLVLRDRFSDNVLAVLDTKYKRGRVPEPNDIQEIVAYAVSMGTENAFLIYPSEITKPFELTVGNMQVRSLIFNINKDLDQSGCAILEQLDSLLSESGDTTIDCNK